MTMPSAPATRRGRPGPLAPWIWHPGRIPPFVLVQVAAMMLFSSKGPSSFQGVPGGVGALLSVAAGIAAGPIAGSLVALVGGWIFVALVSDFRAGSELTMLLWVASAVGSGIIAGRLRRADADRAGAIFRERLAANRLHRLQAVTGALAGATTVEQVARESVSAAMAALGADAGGLTVRAGDDPRTLRVISWSATDESTGAWRDHPAETPSPAAEVLRTGRPLFVETRRELLARFPIVRRIERDQRFSAFAGVPLATGSQTFGALGMGFLNDHMVPPEERGLLVSIAHQAAVAINRIRAVEDERRARASAEHAEDRLRKIQTVTDAANAAVGLDDMLASVLPLVRGAVLAEGTSFLLVAQDRQELRVRASDGIEEAEADERPIPIGLGASGRIAATGRPLVIDELTQDDVVSQALRTRRSYVGVPVRIGGRVVGVLHASSRQPGAFEPEDADFLQSVADSLAVPLERARSFDQRDRMASALERALLPVSLPLVPGFEVATMYRPSHFGDEVGGDFYDVFGDGEIWYLAIGDVCGKGPEAAAIMGMTRVALRSLAREDDTRPLPQVLELLNAFLLESELMGDRFCTVCLARVDLTDGGATITTCLAGHPAPLRIGADGGIDPVGAPGSLLGIFHDVSLREARTVLRPGESIALFTDGVTELSVDRPDEGERLFRSTLRSAANEDAAGIVKTIERALIEPRGELRDDAALVVAKRQPAESRPAGR